MIENQIIHRCEEYIRRREPHEHFTGEWGARWEECGQPAIEQDKDGYWVCKLHSQKCLCAK